MAVAQADTGYGATFERGDGASPESFTAVAEVISITPPQLSREEVDRTHLSSPDSYNEFIGGMRDGGTPTITMAFLPGDTTNADILSDFHDDASDTHNYQISYPDGSTWEFAAFVSGYAAGEIANNERITAEVTFRISGKPTLTPAA